MQSAPVKNIDTKVHGLWRNRLKRSVPKGELLEERARIQKLEQTSQEKTLQISETLKNKAEIQARLQQQMNEAFKKTPGTTHQKALNRTVELENHLHHVIKELELRKAELKEICREVKCIQRAMRRA